MTKEKELPPINEIAENGVINEHPAKFEVCQTHGKDNYLTHTGYIDNQNGTITCTKCGWGTSLPGYMRIQDGKIVDLRGATS